MTSDRLFKNILSGSGSFLKNYIFLNWGSMIYTYLYTRGYLWVKFLIASLQYSQIILHCSCFSCIKRFFMIFVTFIKGCFGVLYIQFRLTFFTVYLIVYELHHGNFFGILQSLLTNYLWGAAFAYIFLRKSLFLLIWFVFTCFSTKFSVKRGTRTSCIEYLKKMLLQCMHSVSSLCAGWRLKRMIRWNSEYLITWFYFLIILVKIALLLMNNIEHFSNEAYRIMKYMCNIVLYIYIYIYIYILIYICI